MNIFEFWNIEFDHKKIHNICGDIKLIANFIIEKSLLYLSKQNFSGNIYLRTLALIFIAKKFIKLYNVCELCDNRRTELIFIPEEVKQVEREKDWFDREKLCKSLTRFIHYNGILKFKNEDFNGQTLSTDDIEYDDIVKIADIFKIEKPSGSNNMHNQHYQFEAYKKAVDDMFVEITNWQSVYSPKIWNKIYTYICDEIYEQSDREFEKYQPLPTRTYFVTPLSHFIETEEPVTNYVMIDGQYLYRCENNELSWNKHPRIVRTRNTTIVSILDLINKTYGCVFNSNPNALLFFEDHRKPIISSSRLDYFNFVRDFKIYEHLYTGWF